MYMQSISHVIENMWTTRVEDAEGLTQVTATEQ